MSFTHNHAGALEYLTAPNITGAVAHCFSTRLGGVSSGHLASLNLGIHRGDIPENVLENYRLLGAAVGFSPEDLVFPRRQVHGDRVLSVGRAQRGQGLILPAAEDCDGLMTNEPYVALTVFSADCTPILLHDPVRGVVAAVHSGWRGTAQGIAQRAVERMTAAYGCRPEDIQAAIGPCIGPCCFETDRDVPEAMIAALGELAAPAIRQQGEKYHVDLKAINCVWLKQAGVSDICVSPDCTGCDQNRYWSHRKTGDRRGSMANIIMLTNPEGAPV